MSHKHNPSYWLIELLAWWEGNVQPSQLALYWQCSRQHASSKLGEYRREYPQALDYDEARKTYHPADSFTPAHISREANEYLNWLTGYSPVAQQQLATVTLEPPSRQITPQLMRPIVQALREGRRLDVDYGSVTSAQRTGRVIAPHHLVKTATRWHIRAWCEAKMEFRDFVLSRFHDAPELLDKASIGSEQDTSWNTRITVILQADPRLTPAKRAVIEHDYGMHNGQLQLETRACMVNYLLQSLNIDPHKIEAEPEAQQLVIVNLKDVRPWLFG